MKILKVVMYVLVSLTIIFIIEYIILSIQLIPPRQLLFTNETISRYEYTYVDAKVDSINTLSVLSKKFYVVRLKYRGIYQSFNGKALYDTVKEGDEIEVILETSLNENGKVVDRKLLLIE